jgi:hypothetical protein
LYRTTHDASIQNAHSGWLEYHADRQSVRQAACSADPFMIRLAIARRRIEVWPLPVLIDFGPDREAGIEEYGPQNMSAVPKATEPAGNACAAGDADVRAAGQLA